MSSPNRSLQIKAARAKVQRAALGAAEGSKPAYATIKPPAYLPIEPERVTRIEQPIRFITREAYVTRDDHVEGFCSTRVQYLPPLRGRSGLRARLRQHF